MSSSHVPETWTSQGKFLLSWSFASKTPRHPFSQRSFWLSEHSRKEYLSGRSSKTQNQLYQARELLIRASSAFFKSKSRLKIFTSASFVPTQEQSLRCQCNTPACLLYCIQIAFWDCWLTVASFFKDFLLAAIGACLSENNHAITNYLTTLFQLFL